MLIRNVNVTVPATTIDLVTLAQVKRELGIDVTESESSDDTILQDMITGYSARFAKYCRRVFVKETVSEDQWPDDGRWHCIKGDQPIILSRIPLVVLTSLNVDDTSIDIADGIRKSDKNGMIWKVNSQGYMCPWNIGKLVNIVYDAGYTMDTMPEDIQRALIMTIKESFENIEQNSRLKSEQAYNVGTWQYFDREDAIMPQSLDMLKDWREPFYRD